MRIGTFSEYRGYMGTIEYDPNNKNHYGRLYNTEDLVTYYAKTVEELFVEYMKSVDDYISMKHEIINKERIQKMDKNTLYKVAFDTIRESTDWGEGADSKVYANYIIGVTDIVNNLIDKVEERAAQNDE